MDLTSWTTLLLAWGGAIAGSIIGILGGVLGTYASIRNTRTAAERALMVRCSIVCWLFVGAFVTGVLLVPQPYNWLLWIAYPFLLVAFIRWTNHLQAKVLSQNAGQ